MRPICAITAAIALLASGCAADSQHRVSAAVSEEKPAAGAELVLASHEADSAEPLQLALNQDEAAASAEQLQQPEPLPAERNLTLAELEQRALVNNPAVAQAAARRQALRGKWTQAGLAPNPTAGYLAGEIGEDRSAGQQGAYVGQTFITARKLQRDRAIVSAEITRAERQLAATQQRVLTDVRSTFYQALLAQRRVELAERLFQVASAAVEASQSLLEAEAIPLAGLLQTEVQQQNAEVQLQTAKNNQQQAWRRLSAVVGDGPLPLQPLDGDATELPEALDWEAELTRLQAESPEIAAAVAQMQRARRALDRAQVEAVPNISTRVSVQHNDPSDFTIAGVQVGMPIPIWNRNQGGILQAQAEVAQAERNLARLELDLSQRLADAFRGYADAHVTATNYAADILPRSQRTLDLVRRGYEQGEVGYLDLLAGQRTYAQANLAYLDALDSLWRNYFLIEGLLLQGSLEQQQLH